MSIIAFDSVLSYCSSTTVLSRPIGSNIFELESSFKTAKQSDLNLIIHCALPKGIVPAAKPGPFPWLATDGMVPF